MGPLGATYNSKAHAPRIGALLQAAGPRQTRTLLWRPPVARCESASTDGSWRALPPPVRRPSSLRAVLWPPSCERWLAAPPALGFGFGFGFGLGLGLGQGQTLNPNPSPSAAHAAGVAQLGRGRHPVAGQALPKVPLPLPLELSLPLPLLVS